MNVLALDHQQHLLVCQGTDTKRGEFGTEAYRIIPTLLVPVEALLLQAGLYLNHSFPSRLQCPDQLNYKILPHHRASVSHRVNQQEKKS